jgi:putative transferase (TIGR04331 family)
MCIRDRTYRAYPKYPEIRLLSYDKEYVLASYLQHIKDFAQLSEPSKVQMLQSKLIIIDYISTSYLEALTMNIPVVFLWNTDAYYLNDDYSDFFKVLVDADICQTDPAKAAKFIESIKDNPMEWWGNPNVQAARNKFLDRNMGKPEVMIEYLTGLIRPSLVTD